jgi:hypothetical protein
MPATWGDGAVLGPRGVASGASDLQISRYRGGDLVESYKDDPIWELTYFGHTR